MKREFTIFFVSFWKAKAAVKVDPNLSGASLKWR